MANERKTEALVRDHFRKFSKEIKLEEQLSENLKIKKLLSLASKAGAGAGYPEFIIGFKTDPDLLLVVECKADPLRHESTNRDKPKDFAVDGVLLYSSYLSKEYDVIAIAVSGESAGELKISHFLQLKGQNVAHEKFTNKLLSPFDYLEGYKKSPEKFRQDYEKLLSFSRELNKKLHNKKILESDRSLLISGILIALENGSFEKTYKSYTKPEDLAAYLVNTIEMEFKNSGIQDEKLRVIRERTGFIKTDTSLSTETGVLMEIVSDINENINRFVKSHEYFDVLSQLYIEFLRYANSDKGLGIVLTPPHVTELMARLTEVNKESVVYDNCTGTGGFLVSAMDVMIKDAKGDQTKIKKIKSKQLIGVEYQAHIFVLACSNMFIHQDGKTNILKGDCFDKEIVKTVQKLRPSVGLLNPPYKSDKKNDIEELEYVLNNLECIEQGGKTAAIVPMSAALARSGKILDLKKRLMEKHTLEAVLSMPDELFINSKVSVVSCIMVFTAKRPHLDSKKVFFGYFKDDGFIKKKNKGRIDALGEWANKKKSWLAAYTNKEDIPGLSVTKKVTAEDEWAAEAYMETDYSALDQKEFVTNVLDYIAYGLKGQLIKDVTSSALGTKVAQLDVSKWKYFDLNDLFKISASRDALVGELSLGGTTPYVTSSDSNNGVTSYVTEEASNPANTITANRGGSVGYFFYQPVPYQATPVDVRILAPKFEMNVYLGLFLKTILQLEKYRYNYSRKMGSDRLEQFRIKLPAKGDQPDWASMEEYIKSLPYSSSLF